MSLYSTVGRYLRKEATIRELYEAYYQDGQDHVMQRKPGVPGVYDILTCIYCGASARVEPEDVISGTYLPSGNVHIPGKCPRSLKRDVPDAMIPAYQRLFEYYKKYDHLRKLIPNCPAGYWPKIVIGFQGVPEIELWDGWNIRLEWGYVAVCREEELPCPRVWVTPEGERIVLGPYGRELDQSVVPKCLKGWEQFKELAMLMYKLPEPDDLSLPWYGRTAKKKEELHRKIEEEIRREGRPLWEIWRKAGEEEMWLAAVSGRWVTREISQDKYEELLKKYSKIPSVCFEVETDDDAEVRFYEVVAKLPDPKPGTQVYFQTGGVSWSSSSFRARVYRATFNGSTWDWEVSKEVYAHDLRERVCRLLDTDYEKCERPCFDPWEKDYLVYEPVMIEVKRELGGDSSYVY